jgi:phospholipid transport system substrate-binding protein
MENSMKRTFLRRTLVLLTIATAVLTAPIAYAEDEAPDVLIKRLLSDVLDTIRKDKAMQAGDTAKLVALVDSRIMPHVNFQRLRSKNNCRMSSKPCWCAPMQVPCHS